MLNTKRIYDESIVNHIYFAKNIGRFCEIIGLTFFKNEKDYIKRALDLSNRALNIGKDAIIYSDNIISKDVIDEEVYITKYTNDINKLTEELFNISLGLKVSEEIRILNTRKPVNYDETIKYIDELNNNSIKLINDFISFCNEIKNKIIQHELFSYLHKDLFDYMTDTANVYWRDIERLINKEDFTEYYFNEYTYYFNEILRKSANYLRAFLDTSHEKVFNMAAFYINSFANLIERYLKSKDDTSLLDETEKLVTSYKNYVTTTLESLLKTDIYFITPSILLDNFLTNINVYLFILKYANKNLQR